MHVCVAYLYTYFQFPPLIVTYQLMVLYPLNYLGLEPARHMVDAKVYIGLVSLLSNVLSELSFPFFSSF